MRSDARMGRPLCLMAVAALLVIAACGDAPTPPPVDPADVAPSWLDRAERFEHPGLLESMPSHFIWTREEADGGRSMFRPLPGSIRGGELVRQGFKPAVLTFSPSKYDRSELVPPAAPPSARSELTSDDCAFKNCLASSGEIMVDGGHFTLRRYSYRGLMTALDPSVATMHADMFYQPYDDLGFIFGGHLPPPLVPSGLGSVDMGSSRPLQPRRIHL
jgi:hypothetical protein